MIDSGLRRVAARPHLPVWLVPGQPNASPAVRAALADGPPLAGAEHEYLELHGSARHALAPLFGAAEGPVVLAGPAALGAWAAARSTVRSGDTAVIVDGGPLAGQLHDAALAAGAQVTRWSVPPGTPPDLAELRARLHAHRPSWVGLVYCEPNHATLCPLPEVVRVIRAASDALVCVDARAAVAGVELSVEAWGIDLCIASADHALSVPVDTALVWSSPRAWRRAEEIGYQGWESLLRWRDPTAQPGHPYAPGAHALFALAVAGREIVAEGLDQVLARHWDVARYTRERLRRAGHAPFPGDVLLAAPTVTGVSVPPGLPWALLVAALADRGVALGEGGDGQAGTLALCGHMGVQADLALVKRALDVLVELLPDPVYSGG